MVAEDGVGVARCQLRVLERGSLLLRHVRESIVVWSKERVLRAGDRPSQPIPRFSAFHIFPYLQITTVLLEQLSIYRLTGL